MSTEGNLRLPALPSSLRASATGSSPPQSGKALSGCPRKEAAVSKGTGQTRAVEAGQKDPGGHPPPACSWAFLSHQGSPSPPSPHLVRVTGVPRNSTRHLRNQSWQPTGVRVDHARPLWAAAPLPFWGLPSLNYSRWAPPHFCGEQNQFRALLVRLPGVTSTLGVFNSDQFSSQWLRPPN